MSVRFLIAGALLAAMSLPGCSMLPTGKKSQRQQVYLVAPTISMAPRTDGVNCGSIKVGAGNASAGFRGPRMVYMRDPFELEYFAYARWGDPPTFMLRDEARRFLEDSGSFDGVLASPVTAVTDWQLEVGDVKLVQRFVAEQSTLQLAFEGRLFDGDRRTLIATRRFEANEPAGGDPRTGVEAANRAAETLLPQLVDFVIEHCDRSER